MEGKSKYNTNQIVPATPEKLWETFLAFRDSMLEDTRTDEKTGTVTHTPLTWVRFMDYMGSSYRPRRFKEYYSAKGKAWAVVIARVENAIEADQLEGAMMGDYNSSIVARINGYTDKTESENTYKGDIVIKHEVTGYKPASSEEEVKKREGL